MDPKTKAVIILCFGDIMFGALSIFTRHFGDMGFSSFTITFIRTGVSALILFIVLLMFKRDCLRVDRKGLLLFLSFTVFKIATDVTFFFALNNSNIALSTMLQMTFPYYVLILSFLIFKESITPTKIAAMLLAFVGCVLLTGGVITEGNAFSEGIIAAIVSGLCLAVYIMGGSVSYKKGYDPSSYILYSSLFSTAILIPFTDLSAVGSAILDINEIPYILGLGVLVSLVPTFMDAWSAKYLLPTTISVIGMLELVSAAVIGVLVFDEILELKDVFGMILVMASILLINIGIFLKFKKYIKLHPDLLEKLKAERERVESLHKR